MPRRKTDFRGLGDATRMRVLAAVQAVPGCTVHELAGHAHLPVNTVRDHIATLVREGLVAALSCPTGSRGRPPIRYRPVDDAAANEAAARRLERARERRRTRERVCGSTAHRDGLGDAERAQLDLLSEHLEDAGLSPAVDERTLTVELVPGAHCPLATREPGMTCAVHAQLVRDTLAQTDGAVRLREVRPFVSADTCLLVLERAAGDAASAADAPSSFSANTLSPVGSDK